MPNQQVVQVDETHRWCVGFGLTDGPCVLVPINQLDGLSPSDIGNYVLGCREEAKLCEVHEIFSHGLDYLLNADLEMLQELAETLKPYIGSEDKRAKEYYLAFMSKIAEWEYYAQQRKAKEERKKNPVPGYVYLFKCEENYKIGMTSNVENRFRQVSEAIPVPIFITHSVFVPSPRKLEKELHKKFSDKRVKREWFVLSKEDVDFIKQIVPASLP